MKNMKGRSLLGFYDVHKMSSVQPYATFRTASAFRLLHLKQFILLLMAFNSKIKV